MCRGDIGDVLIRLPIRQPDGALNTLVCESCAEKSDVYCLTHKRSHLGFVDETTICTLCVEEILEKDGERIAGRLAAAISVSDKALESQQAIRRWLTGVRFDLPIVSSVELPSVVRFLNTPYALNIARAVVAYSQRMRFTPEEVIEMVAIEGAGVILPPEFDL